MATSPLNRKRSFSSSSSTSSGTNSTSSEELHPHKPKTIKLEENSPSYEERRFGEKSSTSTTDSDRESSCEVEPDKKRWKRALYDDNEGRSKPEPSYSSFSMKMMVRGVA